MVAVKDFVTASVPFVVIEAATGIVSLATGQLSMPPANGPGSAVDIAVLLAGLGVSVAGILKARKGKREIGSLLESPHLSASVVLSLHSQN